jgi:hypothetical protein
VARNAISVPRSPAPKIASTTAANTSAIKKAATIDDAVVIGHLPRPWNTMLRRPAPADMAVLNIGLVS